MGVDHNQETVTVLWSRKVNMQTIPRFLWRPWVQDILPRGFGVDHTVVAYLDEGLYKRTDFKDGVGNFS